MGYRSTFTMLDLRIQWPEWFLEKYKETIGVTEVGLLYPKQECKVYGAWIDLMSDMSRVLENNQQVDCIDIVFLYEDSAAELYRVSMYKYWRMWECTWGR